VIILIGMNTEMAIFKNKEQAIESQLTRETPNG